MTQSTILRSCDIDKVHGPIIGMKRLAVLDDIGHDDERGVGYGVLVEVQVEQPTVNFGFLIEAYRHGPFLND